MVLSLFRRSSKRSVSKRRPDWTRPHLEALEDRTVPSTLFVDDSNISGVEDGTQANPFNTIQEAVNVASTAGGDTVQVAAGVYNEMVTVDRAVTLLGAQAGVDARLGSRGSASVESIVQGPGGQTAFYVTADNVTIDGFVVQGATNPNQFGFGIVLGAGTSGSHVLNNIIQNNIVGLALANDSTVDATVIERNLFRNNNMPGPASGTGIYSDEFVAGFGQGLVNVDIVNNTFLGHTTAAITLASTGTDGTAQVDINISANIMRQNGNGIIARNLEDSSISHNFIARSTSSGGAGILLLGDVHDVAIKFNRIQNNAGDGIRLQADAGTSSGVTINFNSLVRNGGQGLDVLAAAHAGVLDATFNWWGAVGGPRAGDGLRDPGGVVDFTPWLIAPPNAGSIVQFKDTQGNVLIVNRATGEYAVFLSSGRVFFGSGATVKNQRLKINAQHNGVHLQVHGQIDGTVRLKLRGKVKATFFLTSFEESSTVG